MKESWRQSTSAWGLRSRSRFLEEAAQEKLERMELEEAIRDSAGVLKGADYPHWRDQEAVNEWVRAQRRTEPAT